MFLEQTNFLEVWLILHPIRFWLQQSSEINIIENQDYARLYFTPIGIIIAIDEAPKNLTTPFSVFDGERSKL